jgi:hypothetical protein
MRYRVAASLVGAWLLVALVSLVTSLGVIIRVSGSLLWVFASYFTLGAF